MTEQGTRYEMDKMICRSTVANGVYDPCRRSAGDVGRSQVGPVD